ncbi:MAG: typA [Microbacterium sp.]|nr:typA [Microbacterium sp.]
MYASGRAGAASRNRPDNGALPDNDDLEPLFGAILEHVPAPSYDDEAPLQAWVTNLDSSPFLGRLALLRVFNGTLKKGQTVAWVRADGSTSNARITELLKTRALERYPAESAGPGDIVAIAGFEDITIGETIADPEDVRPLPQIHVDDPAISMTIGTNTSPLMGKVKGHKLTARMVKDRLDRELIGNVSIRVLDIGRPDAWEVQGRGELALAILVENMRREGFELTVGKPQVVTKQIDGKTHEPFEHLTIDAPEEYLGAITQLLAARKGRMENMTNHGTGWVRMEFIVPSRSSASAPSSSPRPAAPASPTRSRTATSPGPVRSRRARTARSWPTARASSRPSRSSDCRSACRSSCSPRRRSTRAWWSARTRAPTTWM